MNTTNEIKTKHIKTASIDRPVTQKVEQKQINTNNLI